MEAIKNAQWSDENNVEIIRKLRDDILKDFLDERYLREYLATKFNVKELSNIKVEFIKKDLKELLQTPLDLVHYQKVLEETRDSDSDTIAEADDRLCYTEIEKVLIRHLF
jgi:hypothetical protein